MESDERTREERSNPWRNKPLERPPSDEVPNRHHLCYSNCNNLVSQMSRFLRESAS